MECYGKDSYLRLWEKGWRHILLMNTKVEHAQLLVPFRERPLCRMRILNLAFGPDLNPTGTSQVDNLNQHGVPQRGSTRGSRIRLPNTRTHPRPQ